MHCYFNALDLACILLTEDKQTLTLIRSNWGQRNPLKWWTWSIILIQFSWGAMPPYNAPVCCIVLGNGLWSSRSGIFSHRQVTFLKSMAQNISLVRRGASQMVSTESLQLAWVPEPMQETCVRRVKKHNWNHFCACGVTTSISGLYVLGEF